MAEILPDGSEINAPPTLLKIIKPDGKEGYAQGTAEGKVIVDIEATVVDEVSIQPTLENAAQNAWHNGGAGMALTGTYVAGDTMACEGRSSVCVECNLSVLGAAAVVYVEAEVSIDGGATWMLAQTETINPTSGIVTLVDAQFYKAVTAAKIFPVTFRTNGCSHYRVLACADNGVGTTFMARARAAGV